MSTFSNLARTRAPRLVEAAVDRARLTVVPRRPQRAPRVPFMVLVSLLLIGGVAGLLMVNTSMQQSSFTASALQQRSSALAAKEQSLSMSLERLRDPQRLAERARAMGMVPPATPAFLRLSDGRILGRPAPATSEGALRVTDLPRAKPRSLVRPPVRVVAKPSAGPSATGTGPAADGAPGAASGAPTGTTGSSQQTAAGGSTR